MLKYLFVFLIILQGAFAAKLSLGERRSKIIGIVNEELAEVSRLAKQQKYRSPDTLLRLAELNLEKLGLPITAFVTLKSFADKCDELKLLLHQLLEVQSCYRVTGSDHYLAKVVVTSVNHLEQLVDRFIPYATITTSIVLSTPFVGRAIDKDVFK